MESGTTAEENIILDQSPKEGERVAEGDYVTLYIPEVDTYPDFTNGSYTYDDVVEYLEKYNVTINKVEQEDSEHAPGVVIGQSRTAGSRIVSDTSITITVAKESTTPSDDEDDDCGGLC